MRLVLKGNRISILLLAALIFGCHFHKNGNHLNVVPLSPYNDVLTFSKDEDVSAERKDGVKIKYYLIDDDVEWTPEFQNKLQNYVLTDLKQEINDNKAIYFTFYKSSSDLNTDSKPDKASLLKDHLNDKFAEIEYLNGKLYNFDFFKDGAYYKPSVENE